MKRLLAGACISFVFLSLLGVCEGRFLLNLGEEAVVEAGEPASDIVVNGYSVPCYVDWNNDGRKDLIIGEGGFYGDAKVLVYLNEGTAEEPAFGSSFYAQSNGSDLAVPASGCLGCFPRVYYWDEDDKKDLMVGLADGRVKFYKNVGTETEPTFDGGTYMEVGSSGEHLDVGARATAVPVDLHGDGGRDLVVGSLDGKIHYYLGTCVPCEGPTCFLYMPVEGLMFNQLDSELVVAGARSSPVILDLDGDGKNDFLTGNTYGELFAYFNHAGTRTEPVFSGPQVVEANGVAIDLPGYPRSRPSVCDWSGDGYYDVLIGAGDGKVHLYESVGVAGDIDKDYDVDFGDYVIFASAFGSSEGDDGWNRYCDISEPNDGLVGIADLAVFCGHWLSGVEEPIVRSYYDDFETGDFSKLPWQHEGDAVWTIDAGGVGGGGHCAKSGALSDTGVSELEVTLTVESHVKFYLKTEMYYDKDWVRFYIDGEKKGEWTGFEVWDFVTFEVSAGEHTFSWRYEKDGPEFLGSDCVWIDEVEFY